MEKECQDKSSHWVQHTKDFASANNDGRLHIDGFDVYSAFHPFKQWLDIIFHKFLFRCARSKGIFQSKAYRILEEVCYEQGIRLNCDAFRHVCTFHSLMSFLQSKKCMLHRRWVFKFCRACV